MGSIKICIIINKFSITPLVEYNEAKSWTDFSRGPLQNKGRSLPSFEGGRAKSVKDGACAKPLLCGVWGPLKDPEKCGF